MKFSKVASLLVIAVAFVACAHKAKTTTASTTAPTAKQETAKGAKKADAKATAAAAKTAAAPAKAAATTAATTAPSASSVVCKHGQDTRTLEVVAKDGGCEVAYTKFDQTSTPATSASGTAHCESVKEKIKGNLENSGFKCE